MWSFVGTWQGQCWWCGAGHDGCVGIDVFEGVLELTGVVHRIWVCPNEAGDGGFVLQVRTPQGDVAANLPPEHAAALVDYLRSAAT